MQYLLSLIVIAGQARQWGSDTESRWASLGQRDMRWSGFVRTGHDVRAQRLIDARASKGLMQLPYHGLEETGCSACVWRGGARLVRSGWGPCKQ